MSNAQDNRCENCIIRQLNSLKALNSHELKLISETKVSKTFKKGDVIFKEGEKLSGVYCVRNGVSKLSKLSPNGNSTIVKIATKGEVLGQRSVLINESTNLSATAVKDMEVCYIPKNHLTNNINTNPKFTKAVLIHMANELKFADNLIINMAQKNVRQRVAETLMYLDTNFGTDEQGYIKIILTREDIANIVGTAKEACIRTLTLFKKENSISTDGKRIRLDNKKALINIINEN